MDLTATPLFAEAPLVLPVVASHRRGWYTALDERGLPFVGELAARIAREQNLPGLTPLGAPPILMAPRGLVRTRPDRFRVVSDFHPPSSSSSNPTSWPCALRPYQREALTFALDRGGALLALDMGTGKTRLAAATAKLSALERVLVIGPNLARAAWVGPRSDVARALNIPIVPLSGRKDLDGEPLAETAWVYCHYEILPAWLGWLQLRHRPRVVILDESHYCTSSSAQRTRAALALSRLYTVELRLALSGTPIRNGVIDLWPQLEFVQPDAWGRNRSEFGEHFLNGRRGPYAMTYDAAPPPDRELELSQRLADVMIRKTLAEVLPELPPLTRQAVTVDLDDDQRLEYRDAERDVRAYLEAHGHQIAASVHNEDLVRLTKLLILTSRAKVPFAIEQAREALRVHPKVVIFTWFRESATGIARGLRADGSLAVFGPATGADSVEERIDLAGVFAASDAPAVFVATIESCGVALQDLCAASCVVFNDLWWVPPTLAQAEARLHRDGQSRGVLAIYLVAQATVDELLMTALEEKIPALEATGLEGGERSILTTLGPKHASDSDLLGEIVESLRRHLEAA